MEMRQFGLVLLLWGIIPNTSCSNFTPEQINKLMDTFKYQLQDTLRSYQYSVPGVGRYQPLYTREADPGFFKMGSELVRQSPRLTNKFENWVESGVDWITQPRTKAEFLGAVAYTGLAITTIPLMTIVMKKMAETTLDIIKYKMTTPKVEILSLEAHPKYGRMDRLSRWWAGYKTPAVILDEAVKEHLEEIKEKTKNIRDHILAGDKKATYANLLLYGPPGTGKTLFARVLADYADMDFLPTTAAGLLQSPVAFNDLLEMAKRSTYGTIIFIDEADALFIDRNKLLQSTAPDALAQYKALNHIMATTGQRNNKFMIVAATNHAYVMDDAMNRRFPEKVEMSLPDATTRLALLTLYINNEIFDEKNNSKAFVEAARLLITPEKINEMVKQTEGFSHANIQDMIKAMRDASRATKDDIITANNVNNAIKRAVHDYRMAEENKKKREQKFELPADNAPAA